MRQATAFTLILSVVAAWAWSQQAAESRQGEEKEPYVVVLGIAQDGGYPQAGCSRACCLRAWSDPSLRRQGSSLAVVDPETGQRWLLDATPDFREQLRMLDKVAPVEPPGISGILLTHGHMGHYTGLMHLGREAMGTRQVPVWALPKMARFLRSNGPWSQLVQLGNIDVRQVSAGQSIALNHRLEAMPILVPHRQEYTEAAGFRIHGPQRSVLYISDIDAWDTMKPSIEELISQVDIAYLDGTFFSGEELPGRDLSEIPHPFIEVSVQRFLPLPASERSKIRFIHLNHTNPALVPDSPARQTIESAGMAVAEELDRESL